jgi:hypothetical protein
VHTSVEQKHYNTIKLNSGLRNYKILCKTIIEMPSSLLNCFKFLLVMILSQLFTINENNYGEINKIHNIILSKIHFVLIDTLKRFGCLNILDINI